jgi:hypothetical protein
VRFQTKDADRIGHLTSFGCVHIHHPNIRKAQQEIQGREFATAQRRIDRLAIVGRESRAGALAKVPFRSLLSAAGTGGTACRARSRSRLAQAERHLVSDHRQVNDQQARMLRLDDLIFSIACRCAATPETEVVAKRIRLPVSAP